ncbi:rho GTPase-activating protein 21 isoform X2 [Musca domestica]|uniref:Rho GTPase-activating protein 21 isoform X2 n=1 Tax=Musca domestica TaxID=7370 RepID=A0ABM3UWT5_MUSDO|nr:rho GTPase-activating protein 21 isoform X2 [Musca domestica]
MLQNSSTPSGATAATTPTTSGQQSQQQMPQPKLVVIRRRPNQGFGFTLRHFIAYPPEDDPSWPQEASEPYQVKAMETIFIKEVHPNGPAYYANLQTGDRVLMVNNTPIAGIAYSTIVSMIKQTPSELKLLVVPKECDVLQMHYTSIAHTPQSNVMGSSSCTSSGSSKSIPSPIVTAGNGGGSNATNSSHQSVVGGGGGGALLPMSVAMAGRPPFPLHQQQHQLISFPASSHQQHHYQQQQAAAASRSGSISSTNSLRPLTTADYMELSTTLSSTSSSSAAAYHHQIQQQQQHHSASNMLQHSDSGSYLRSPPANLTVLTRQQQLQQQQNAAAFYASNAAVDTSDLMIRLRESIKQKEEFLKSPLPNVHQQQHQQQQQQQQQQQHFFPHTPPSGSPQLSMVSTSSTSVGGSGSSSAACVVGGLSFLSASNSNSGSIGSNATARGQVRTTLVKQPLSATSSTSSTRELLTANCDMHYAPNLGGGSSAPGGSGGGVGTTTMSSRSQQQQQQQQQRLATTTTSSSSGIGSSSTNGSSSMLRDKYHKDYEFMETLQETGVTNKVFESKLVSHLARGFDPFKPLSINTNAIESATTTTVAASATTATAPGNSNNSSSIFLKKPSVLYDSLHHHPLHQMQVQQQQHIHSQLHQQHVYQQQQQTATAPKMTVPSAAATNSLTATTSTPVTNATTASSSSSSSVVDGHRFSRMEIYKASVANATIDHQANNTTSVQPSSSSSSSTVTASGGSNVIRRFRPMSSFDDSKPMRRISYLRATNDDYHDTSATSLANSSTSSIAETLSTKSNKSQQQQHIEEHLDPIYDTVGGGGGADSTSDSLDALEDLKLDASASSRRTSVNSDFRRSVHIDSSSGIDLNGKMESKDISTDMEIFETEMEIKSSSIHGKRQSEYRSWRQVKIEIKGDILRIYPSRNTKSDSNVLELDIRNFEIFDESDKKKYVFRMQSKPSPIATLGNELNIDDVPDKLTSSTGSSSSTQQQTTAAEMGNQPQNQPHTDILFKTKSGSEMKRIYGLLQWKNSLIFNDNDPQGKQLAEPQKTAATASMSTTNSNYCDDNVQQQSVQHLQAEHSPLSSTSRSELEAPDSISPVMKTRKSSSHKNIPDKDLGSPKAKNWKDLLFRRGGGSSSSGHSADLSPSNLSSSSKTVGSIGVPLKTCPMSKSNEYVPTLVDVCTNIVETKGLGVVGIYRIPGNKAAISELSDQVNKSDFSWDRCNTDVRWEDVNVVSSLLKLFIRSLPDALLPSSFYSQFIEADKKEGMERLTELKALLEALPRYSHETMKHLFRHLNRVSKHCDVNLMEPKNLAIIFGPSIIRTPNDALDVAVKDMKHQCRIVELLLTHYDYFFENAEAPDIDDVCGNNIAPSSSSSTTGAITIQQQQQQQQEENQTNMLLHNISKIERLTERESSSSSTTTTSRSTSRFIRNLGKPKSSKRPEPATYDNGLSLDYAKSGATASSSSSSSTTTSSAKTSKKKEHHGFLSSRARSHARKSSLDEKDSGSVSGSSIIKDTQRNSVDISITLTDDESSNSRLSEPGSMSLGIITDTLESKLSKLRSGSESNDENGSPDFPMQRRYTLGEPLHILHTENIPYADESPERHFHNFCPLDSMIGANNLMLSRSCTSTNTLMGSSAKSTSSEKEKSSPLTGYKGGAPHKLQHSATAPINSSIGSVGGVNLSSPPTAASTPTTIGALKGSLTTASSARNAYATSKNLRFSSSVQEQRCSEDDSEGSTTSDPKEALAMASPSFLMDKYNKKRRDHRLYRSASFNCRNYSSRYGGSNNMTAGSNIPLTKDEKTDMNLTKKRQIQNKQNRSIKRRHTVGGPHDYSGNAGQPPAAGGNNCNHHCKNNMSNSGSSNASNTSSSGITRTPLSSANSNIANNNNNMQQHGVDDGGHSSATSNGNSSSSNNTTNNTASTTATTVNVANSSGEHVLEVGIRIKNINRARF